MSDKALWTDKRILRAWNDGQDTSDDIALLGKMRDEYEAALAALRQERDALQVKLRMKTEAYNFRGDCLDAAQQRIAELEDAPPCVEMTEHLEIIESALLRYEYMHDVFLEPTQTAKAKAALAWVRQMIAEIGGQGDESAGN